MTCHEATDELARLTAAAAADPGGMVVPEGLVDHIAGCAHCLDDLAVIGVAATGSASATIRAVFAESGCELVSQLLPEWATSDAAGAPPLYRSHPAWQHVESCDRCRAEFTDLCGQLSAAASGAYGPAVRFGATLPLDNDLVAFMRRSADQGSIGMQCVNAPAWSGVAAPPLASGDLNAVDAVGALLSRQPADAASPRLFLNPAAPHAALSNAIPASFDAPCVQPAFAQKSDLPLQFPPVEAEQHAAARPQDAGRAGR